MLIMANKWNVSASSPLVLICTTEMKKVYKAKYLQILQYKQYSDKCNQLQPRFGTT